MSTETKTVTPGQAALDAFWKHHDPVMGPGSSDWNAVAAAAIAAHQVQQGQSSLNERIAQLAAHRACHSAEHDPLQGRIHGYCIVCGVPWPCEIAKPAGASPQASEPAAPTVTDPAWVRQMAEKEGNCIVSVGGLVATMGDPTEPQYRYFEPIEKRAIEITQEGDEWEESPGRWKPAVRVGCPMGVHTRYRRRIVPAATCVDCWLPYERFGTDFVFSHAEWKELFPPKDGLLCGTCICRRVAQLPDSVAIDAKVRRIDPAPASTERPPQTSDMAAPKGTTAEGGESTFSTGCDQSPVTPGTRLGQRTSAESDVTAGETAPNPEWIRQMAEKEGNCIVSVGLISEIEPGVYEKDDRPPCRQCGAILGEDDSDYSGLCERCEAFKSEDLANRFYRSAEPKPQTSTPWP